MCKGSAALLIAAALFCCGCSRHPTWTYKGDFHKAIANADRVEVLDGGFDHYGQDTKARVLFGLSKPDEIRELAERLEFHTGQALSVCPCNGYPRVDWYQGKHLLAAVSIQHCQAIRWKGFQADAKLTATSGQWLREWLTDHGVDAAKMK